MSDDNLPRATSRLFLLLGDPVAHSLSPIFQNAAMRARGVDALYAALRCDRQSVAPLMRALCRAGGGGNVTVPYKATAAEFIERPTPAVIRTRACNTFWGEDGTVCGDNTDVEGFRTAALRLQPILDGASVLLLGAGGAATAALAALLDENVARVLILNRSPDRATLLAQRLDPERRSVRAAASSADAFDADFDLVVNATSPAIGPYPQLPLDLSRCRRIGAALDLAYAADGSTPFVRHARRLGIPAEDGTAMLLAQGAAAFTRWFGGAPPLHIMTQSLSP